MPTSFLNDVAFRICVKVENSYYLASIVQWESCHCQMRSDVLNMMTAETVLSLLKMDPHMTNHALGCLPMWKTEDCGVHWSLASPPAVPPATVWQSPCKETGHVLSVIFVRHEKGVSELLFLLKQLRKELLVRPLFWN